MALVKKISGLHRINNYQINIQFKRFVKTENFVGRKIDLSNNFSRHKLQAYMDLQAHKDNKFTNKYYDSLQLINSSIELVNNIHNSSEYSYETLDFTGVNNIIMEIPQIIMLVKEDNLNYDKVLVEFYKKILIEEEETIRNLNEKLFEDLSNTSKNIATDSDVETSSILENKKIIFKKLIIPTALIIGGLVIFYIKVIKSTNTISSTVENNPEIISSSSESSSIPLEENITYDAPSKIESFDGIQATDILASEVKTRFRANLKVMGQEANIVIDRETTIVKLANMLVKTVLYLFQN